MLYFFYIYSLLSCSPIFLLYLIKNPIKNKVLNIILIVLSGIKSLFDLLIYFIFLTELGMFEKILVTVIVCTNLYFYLNVTNNQILKEKILNFFKKLNSQVESNFREIKNKNISEEKKSSSSIFDEKIIQEISSEISKEINIGVTSKTNNSKKVYRNIIEEVREYLDTGEIFSFYYKGASDYEYNLRNIVVNEIYSQFSYTYIKGIDIDINAPRTFRADRMLSITQEASILSATEVEELKAFYEKAKSTKAFIEKINFTNPTKFFDISDEIDIISVLSNGGFIKKDGRNCQIFDNSFKYLGSKLWNITSLKKNHPYILTPRKTVFISSLGYSDFEFFTYTSEIIEDLNNYDEEKLKEVKAVLKLK